MRRNTHINSLLIGFSVLLALLLLATATPAIASKINHISVQVKFSDVRFQNHAMDDLMPEPDANGYSWLPHAKVILRCFVMGDDWYVLETGTDSTGSASGEIETPSMPAYCGSTVYLEDGNSTSLHRWLVTDDSSSDPDMESAYTYNYTQDLNGDYYWSLGQVVYASGGGESQSRAGLHATADMYYQNVVTESTLLLDRYGKDQSDPDPNKCGIGELKLRMDSSYTYACGNASCSENSAIKIKEGCASQNDRHAHELGHVSQHLLHKGTDGYPGFLPEAAGSNFQLLYPNYASERWGTREITEGWANFMAVVARWPQNASDPQYRPGNGFYIEKFPANSECFGSGTIWKMFRHEYNFTRYLWDLYDDHQDSSSFNKQDAGDPNWTDTYSLSIAEIINELEDFWVGANNRYYNHGCDEREDGSSSGLGYDQPNPRDYWWQMDAYLDGISQAKEDWNLDMYYMNCLHVWEAPSNGDYRWLDTGRSRECSVDSDCAPGWHCNSANYCVECANDSHCSGTQTCNTSTWTCQCSSNSDCTGIGLCSPFTNRCYCTEDSDCSNNWICDTENYKCVQCLSHSDCVVPTNPGYCNNFTKRCYCVNNSGCLDESTNPPTQYTCDVSHFACY